MAQGRGRGPGCCPALGQNMTDHQHDWELVYWAPAHSAPGKCLTCGISYMEATMKVCDHHDLPLVCDTCGYEQSLHAAPDTYAGRLAHPFRPVHILVDPEGFEGNQLIPCPL
jgi:hypothetical protein